VTVLERDPLDAQQVRRADGLLAEFNRVGVLGAADVHVARRLRRLAGERDERVLLAAALAVRAVRHGSVCVEVTTAADSTAVDDVAADEVAALPWPETGAWVRALEESPLVAVGDDGPDDRPLRWVDGLLYLDRYWRQEQVIARYVDSATSEGATSATAAIPDAATLRAALDRLFTGRHEERQRLAAVVAAHRRLSILAGGPGTGKTTTVAKILAVLQELAGGGLRVALAAPTGKAAARLQEAAAAAAADLPDQDKQRLGELKASTLHRLLGWRPGSQTRFRHDRDNRLPHDVVVVDEASMVSLTMMSRLVEALRPGCRLLLVGDPDQLASVEVGAVLGDLVERPLSRRTAGSASSAQVESLAEEELAGLDPDERQRAVAAGVVRLSHVFRFRGAIQDLAEAIRRGEAEAVLAVLDREDASTEFVEADPATTTELDSLHADVLGAGSGLVTAARAGDAERALAALGQHRVLCAHREGAYGVSRWGALVEQWLAEEIDGYGREGLWYVGRPLLVTANDYALRLFNGDSGVVVDVDGHPRAAFWRDGEIATLPTSRLSDVQTVHAMSVHRSQGSQFDRVTVVLPPAESPLLTRELFYTAVTRAKEHVRIIGTREALAAAVGRRIVRASGLGRRHVG
jgi:exodeoxyribonuclease V alpha subunit